MEIEPKQPSTEKLEDIMRRVRNDGARRDPMGCLNEFPGGAKIVNSENNEKNDSKQMMIMNNLMQNQIY